jgi:hypothetical protein
MRVHRWVIPAVGDRPPAGIPQQLPAGRERAAGGHARSGGPSGWARPAAGALSRPFARQDQALVGIEILWALREAPPRRQAVSVSSRSSVSSPGSSPVAAAARRLPSLTAADTTGTYSAKVGTGLRWCGTAVRSAGEQAHPDPPRGVHPARTPRRRGPPGRPARRRTGGLRLACPAPGRLAGTRGNEESDRRGGHGRCLRHRLDQVFRDRLVPVIRARSGNRVDDCRGDSWCGGGRCGGVLGACPALLRDGKVVTFWNASTDLYIVGELVG